MPVGFEVIDELLGTEFAARWESPRKRVRSVADEPQATATRKRSKLGASCPHSMTVIRSSRHAAGDKKQCSICFEGYFTTTGERGRVVPVKLGCQHVFCRECIETHLSANIRCPLPWCEAQFSLRPEQCELCAYWERTQASCLVLTIRAQEMASSIKDGLDQLAADSHFFKIPKGPKERLMAHVRGILKRYEWQYHSGIDVAELLDPFLLAVDLIKAKAHYGVKLSAPAPSPSRFPPRTHDLDDYPIGEEPWVAAFFRQWALDYERENGEAKHGWGVFTKKSESHSGWEWPYKRITAHRTELDGQVRYLVKWVGHRFPASWVSKDELAGDAHVAYDQMHGIVHPG